jgi:hypothetical protein
MKHYYEMFNSDSKALYMETDKFHEAESWVENGLLEKNHFIKITDLLKNQQVACVFDYQAWESWRVTRERDIWLTDRNEGAKPKDAVNPTHYKGYIFDMQWIEAMQFIPRYRDPEVFKGALELQVRKYLDRLGKKDSDIQELQKSLWYLRFLVAYSIKNAPIKFSEIDDILNGKL